MQTNIEEILDLQDKIYQAHKAGFSAFMSGKGLEDNPYKGHDNESNILWRSWIEGHADARGEF